MAVLIEGMDDALRWLDKLPATGKKVAEKVTRTACRRVTQTVRAKTPTRWRRLIKGKVRNRNGVVNAGVGAYNDRRSKTRTEIPDWFKAYWQNYGTLSRRSPDHDFVYPIKPENGAAGRRRRNRLGIRPRNWWELAKEGIEEQFADAVFEETVKATNDFYER